MTIFLPQTSRQSKNIKHFAGYCHFYQFGNLTIVLICVTPLGKEPLFQWAHEEEGLWMSLPELSALLKKHFKNYKEEEGTFVKIGSYLNRPEYKFQSKHTMSGTQYWIKLRV